ncbi:MAG: PhoH family protein [Victivallaceae bacterium]
MTEKTVVVDTSVFIYDPQALDSFSENKIVLPLAVLEELESLSKFRDESAKNSARALANIKVVLGETRGIVNEFVKLKNGASFKVAVLPHREGEQKNYRMTILDLLKNILQEDSSFMFMTKSLTRRVRAEAMGIETMDYENQNFSFKSLYKGFRKIEVGKESIDTFYKDRTMVVPPNLNPISNEYFSMEAGERDFALGRYDSSIGKIVGLLPLSKSVWGIEPLNLEQKFALDLLLRDEIKLVSLMGQAGTGKTVLALAAAMKKVFGDRIYHRILISRPIVPLGKDIGFLPGVKEEKLMHWMQPIYDNLEFIFGLNGFNDFGETFKDLIENKKIEMEALTYIRGRSLPNIVIIIDEAQNLTPHELKTIVSRAGKGTKIILTGDPTQIDSPYFDENSNGLTYLVGKFRNLPLYGHMFMEKTERSDLAAAAAHYL